MTFSSCISECSVTEALTWGTVHAFAAEELPLRAASDSSAKAFLTLKRLFPFRLDMETTLKTILFENYI